MHMLSLFSVVLFFTTVSFAEGICNRSPQISSYLSQLVGKDCADVSAEDLSKLDSIDLEDSGLTGLQAGDFDGLTGVLEVYLDGNDLPSLPPGIFKDLTSNTLLWMDLNGPLSPGVFENMTQLYELYISFKGEIPQDLLKGLTKLYYIELWAPEATAIPENIFADQNSVRYLYAQFGLSPKLTFTLANMTKLKELGLWGVNINNIPNNFLSSPYITDLEFHLGKMPTLPSDIFKDQTALKYLDLSENGLEQLSSDTFQGLEKLKSLSLENNKLSNLPTEIFKDLKALRDLNLMNNNLPVLSPEIFSGLNLLFLAIDYKSSSEDLLQSLNLIGLETATPKMELITPDYLKNKPLLDLIMFKGSKVKGDQISPDLFKYAPQATRISINGFNFEDLPANLFQPLLNMMDVELNNDELTHLPSNLFNGLFTIAAPHKYGVGLKENHFSDEEKQRIKDSLPSYVDLSF